MRFSVALPPFVMSQEGLSLRAYWDKNAWRIGYGTAVPGIGPQSVCTPEQAKLWLEQDLDELSQELTSLIKVPVTQCQFDALGSFVYNIGVGAFKGSTLLELLNEGKYDEAAGEFVKWDHVHDEYGNLVESADLRERRLKEQAIFLGKGTPGYDYPVGG